MTIQHKLRTIEMSTSGAIVTGHREFHYRWVWHLKSSPEMLWPLVANTDRFNRDTNVPKITLMNDEPIVNGRRKLKMYRIALGPLKLVPIVWYEEPFEWMQPHRFGVVRNYVKGPVRQMRVQADLNRLPDGSTEAVYQVWIIPANLLGYAAIPLQVGFLSARDFKRVFHEYDRLAQENRRPDVELAPATSLAAGGRERLMRGRTSLRAQGAEEALIDRLFDLIEHGDELTLMRLRPYALADAWGADRRAVLTLCLMATRAGLLDLRWELLCPQCRGAKEVDAHLEDVNPQVHCDVCNIDFDVNFEYSVELTFRPNDSVRMVEDTLFCMGGPQVTPHIAAQAMVAPGEQVQVEPELEPGRYRVRALTLQGAEPLRAAENGDAEAVIAATGQWHTQERIISLRPRIIFENDTADAQLFILERMRWSDQAVTAAEVTSMQVFRDLFSNEALRSNIQMSVGGMTLMFTDLRGSTRLYREIGDAPAFGRVMDHFDVLREFVAAHDGAIVKTLGDAVMAVFRRPVNAVLAAMEAQAALANPDRMREPLLLKVGINTGSAIAVTLNDRLDYFGTTVNLAARLTEASTGSDIVVSDSVRHDPEVTQLLDLRDVTCFSDSFIMQIRGFDDAPLRLHRIGLTKLNQRQISG
jgi:adenylate cyclase